MDFLNIKINHIKNIKKVQLSIPLIKGIYGIVGNNGTGKSTIMECLAQVVFSHSLDMLRDDDLSENSSVVLNVNKKTAHWYYKDNKWRTSEHYRERLHFNGMYEGSLFYGTRFNDSKIVDDLIVDLKIKIDDIVDADEYIKNNLSYILHGNYDFYKTLKRLRNKKIAADLHLDNTPYFQKVNERLISQYRMSSGECLLISLLHFIYNAIVNP